MYEDLLDKKVIDDFERAESEGSVNFVTADDILNTF